MAPLQDMWYREVIFHLICGSLGGDLSMFSSTSSLSRSNTTFDTGLSTMLFLPAWLTLPIFNLTLCTNPFHDSTYLPIIPDGICFLQDHNISKFQVPFGVCPFLLSWSDCKNSFFQLHQNSFSVEPVSIFCSCINQV